MDSDNGRKINKKAAVVLPIVLVIIAACIIIPVLVIKTHEGERKYIYKNEEDEQFRLKEAIYSENKLVLKLKTEWKYDINRMQYYDAEFNEIKSGMEFSYSSGMLTIKGNDAEKISGLTIYFEGDEVSYVRLRYLDSDRYAVLKYLWATDVGPTTFDDDDLFLTQAEKDMYAQKKKEEEERQNALYEKYCGEWYSKEDPELYFKMYVNDRGIRCIEYTIPLAEGYYDTVWAHIDDIKVGDQCFRNNRWMSNGKKYLTIKEITYVENDHSFEIFEEDENKLAYEDIVYYRKNN